LTGGVIKIFFKVIIKNKYKEINKYKYGEKVQKIELSNKKFVK